MALISRNGFERDEWVHTDDAQPAPANTPQIVSPERLSQRIADGVRTIGVAIDNERDLAQIISHLDAIALIAIRFQSAADGRGFSLARKVRRLGFKRELRAVGPLIADQFAFALSCGFDTVEIPAEIATRQSESQWLDALQYISHSYQSHARGVSVFEQRHRHATLPHRSSIAS